MQNLSKLQIAAALVATLGLAAHGTANADPTGGGSTLEVSEKQAPSEISRSVKLAEGSEEQGKAEKKEKKERKEKKDKQAKGKEMSCKGNEMSCKGKDGSCKGKDGSCKGKEMSCKGKEGAGDSSESK